MRPYYFVTADYSQLSAGIVTFYELAFLLSELGVPAFVTGKRNLRVPVKYKKLVLTAERHKEFIDAKVNPIYVATEATVLHIKKDLPILRYFLNLPGNTHYLGKLKSHKWDWAFCAEIAELVNVSNVLYFPITDPSQFKNDESIKRNDVELVYLGKICQKLSLNLENYVPIYRHGRNRQTREEIIKLFQTSKRLHVFENTALSLEATLCGCPVTLHKNPYFETAFAMNDLKWIGFEWEGDDSNSSATVKYAWNNYSEIYKKRAEKIPQFVAISQNQVPNSLWSINPFKLYHSGRLKRLMNVLYKTGPLGVIRHSKTAIQSRIK